MKQLDNWMLEGIAKLFTAVVIIVLFTLGLQTMDKWRWAGHRGDLESKRCGGGVNEVR